MSPSLNRARPMHVLSVHRPAVYARPGSPSARQGSSSNSEAGPRPLHVHKHYRPAIHLRPLYTPARAPIASLVVNGPRNTDVLPSDRPAAESRPAIRMARLGSSSRAAVGPRPGDRPVLTSARLVTTSWPFSGPHVAFPCKGAFLRRPQPNSARALQSSWREDGPRSTNVLDGIRPHMSDVLRDPRPAKDIDGGPGGNRTPVPEPSGRGVYARSRRSCLGRLSKLRRLVGGRPGFQPMSFLAPAARAAAGLAADHLRPFETIGVATRDGCG